MASSRRAVTILMASHLYWLQIKCLMALKGVRNHRRLVSGRLERKKNDKHCGWSTALFLNRIFKKIAADKRKRKEGRQS